MSVSLWPSAVYCSYVAAPCLWHSAHLLPYLKYHVPCPFHSVQHLSTFTLLSHVCGTRPFASLVMSCPMSVSIWPSAVHCYVVVPCLWHSVHLLPYLKCHAPCPFHSVQHLSTVMLLSHVCGSQSICCLTWNVMPHVCFTLSNICLLLCCCPMNVVLGPFAVSPTPTSFYQSSWCEASSQDLHQSGYQDFWYMYFEIRICHRYLIQPC